MESYYGEQLLAANRSQCNQSIEYHHISALEEQRKELQVFRYYGGHSSVVSRSSQEKKFKLYTAEKKKHTFQLVDENTKKKVEGVILFRDPAAISSHASASF